VHGRALLDVQQPLRCFANPKFFGQLRAVDTNHLLVCEKLLRSAVANAENTENGVDTDDLVVSKIYVNEGPREKRVQPAPMGRAYRIQKRKAHVTVHVSDEVKAVNARSGETKRSTAPPPAAQRKTQRSRAAK